MKFILPLLLFPATCLGQKSQKDPYGDKFPVRDSKVFYEYIDTFPDQSKRQLFDKVAVWASGSFRNSQEANQLVDPEKGEYVARGSLLDQGFIADVLTFFTLRVSVKDNKCRVQIYNIDLLNSVFPNAAPTPAEKVTSKKWIRKLNAGMDGVAIDIFTSLKDTQSGSEF